MKHLFRWFWTIACLGLFLLPVKAADLVSVYKDAMRAAPVIQRAEALKLAARADYHMAGSVFLPQFHLSGSVDDNDVETEARYQSSQMTASITQLLFHRKAWYMARSAGLAAQASKYRYQFVLQQFVGNVAVHYLAVLEAKQKAMVEGAQYLELKTFYTNTLHQYQVGMSSGVDLAKAKASMDEAYAERIAADQAFIIAQEQLAGLTGRYYQTFAQFDQDYAISLEDLGVVEAWKGKALVTNQEIKEQVLLKDIQKQSINVERSSYIPTVVLVASVTNYNQNLGGVMSENGHLTNRSVGLQFAWNVFEGASYAHKIAKQRDLLLSSDYNLTLKRREVAQNIQIDWADLQTFLNQQQAYARMLSASEAALKSYQVQFETGVVTMVDVLEKIKAYYQAQSDYYHAQHSAILAWFALKRDVGVLGVEDLRALNQRLVKESE